MNQQKKYFENLDASRFFAFIIVFLAHGFIAQSIELKSDATFQFIYHWGKLGILGLEYFFVLSSFLISWIILEEKSLTKHFNIKNFLIRRSLRVWPLYFLIVGIGFATSLILQHQHLPVAKIPEWHHFFLFIINFYVIENGNNFMFFLVFLWSISIEEQFYLLYSLSIKYLRINLLHLSFLLIIISLVFRGIYLDTANTDTLFYHTLSAFGNFGVGGILAYISFHKKPIFCQLTQLNKKTNVAFYVLLILSIIFYHELNQFKWFTLFSRLYFALLFGYYILEQAFGEHRLFNPGKNKYLNYFGRISYGLYCFHGIVITVLVQIIAQFNYSETFWHVLLIYPAIIFTCTLFSAYISFNYYEKYFLKFKNKFYTFAS